MSFHSDIDKWIEKIENNSDQIFKDSVSTLYSSIVSETPVDTGHAKEGWKLDIQPEKAEIINPVDYIIYLEYGHSKQAPQGMVRKNVQKWNQIVTNEASKYK